ncbi:MAG: ABC transporter permease, partial [Clostridia bacterium]|nr:ABC transporter permease [Clostridia bacterium]
MFLHNFKYSLFLLLKNKSLVFWTVAFPIIMALLFNMAFSDLESEDKLDIINIAVVNSVDFDNNMIFRESLESLSEGDDRLFNISYV